MSGICGIFNRDGKPVRQEDLDRMMSVMAHRGPDGSGTWRDGPVGLGHLMLHTTPESLNEKLPLKNATGDLVITADARIDNREELFEALRIPHPERKGMPDSELILKAYEKWGEGCLERLLGDFIFAIWNNWERRLFCARDHMGVRAFYYFKSTGCFCFATEIKGVLAVPDVPRQLNETAVADYLVFNRNDLKITFYEKIQRLPPSQSLIVKNRGHFFQKYWELQTGKELQLKSDSAYAEALHELMATAIACRLRTDFPAGIMLSGGLDSSTITYFVSRKLLAHGKCLDAFSAVLPTDYPGIEKDEREYIECLGAEIRNLEVTYVLPDKRPLFSDLPSLFQRMDQPVRDPYYYIVNALLTAAQQKKTRLLFWGFGGDMTVSFSGAGYLAELATKGKIAALIRLVKELAAVENKKINKIYKNQVIGLLLPDLLTRHYRRLKGTESDNNIFSKSAICPTFAAKTKIAHRCALQGHSLGVRLSPNVKKNMESIANHQNMTSPLEEMDVLAGFHQINLVVPFIDKRIIEFCLNVPSKLYIRHGWKRYLIRAAMADKLPVNICWRKDKLPLAPNFHSNILMSTDLIVKSLLSADKNVSNKQCVVDKKKILNQLKSVKPVNGFANWDYNTPLIISFGFIANEFYKWFMQNQPT